MRAGDFDKLVSFEERIWIPYGEMKQQQWQPAFKEWAKVERLSEQLCRFTIRYRSDVSPAKHRIIFFDQVWSVTYAVPDRKLTHVLIDCDFSALIEVTHMQSETREYVEGLPVVRPPAND